MDHCSLRRRGLLIVLSSPSGAGKTTVSRRLLEADPEIAMSVSATTRAMRAGEVDGTDYRFVDDAEFDRMIADGELLEWAVVHRTARYGTPRRPVEEALAVGHPALLEIDLQGARQVRASMPDALFVFLRPPTWEELVRRLVGRGTESEEERVRRLETAREELAAQAEFDVSIVNREVHAAAEELVALMELDHGDSA